jgi:hypothetical protein
LKVIAVEAATHIEIQVKKLTESPAYNAGMRTREAAHVCTGPGSPWVCLGVFLTCDVDSIRSLSIGVIPNPAVWCWARKCHLVPYHGIATEWIDSNFRAWHQNIKLAVAVVRCSHRTDLRHCSPVERTGVRETGLKAEATCTATERNAENNYVVANFNSEDVASGKSRFLL